MVPERTKPKSIKLAKEKEKVRAMSWSEILAKINHYVSVHGKLPGN